MRISDWSSDVCSSDLGIFKAGVQPLLAVAMAARHSHDGIRAGNDPVSGYKSDQAGKPGISRRHLVRPAHSAANDDVKAFQAVRTGKAMKPRSCAYTSMSFDGGKAKPILNVRGM